MTLRRRVRSLACRIGLHQWTSAGPAYLVTQRVRCAWCGATGVTNYMEVFRTYENGTITDRRIEEMRMDWNSVRDYRQHMEELLAETETLILNAARNDLDIDKSDWIRLWVKIRRERGLPWDSGDWKAAYEGGAVLGAGEEP